MTDSKQRKVPISGTYYEVPEAVEAALFEASDALKDAFEEIAKLKQERDEITAILNEWEEAVNVAKAGRKE